MKFSLNKTKNTKTKMQNFGLKLGILAIISAFLLINPTPTKAISLKNLLLAFNDPNSSQIVPENSEDEKKFPESEDREPIRTIRVLATAYSSEPAQTDDTPCIPANGYDLCKHYEKFGYGDTIAANFLPFETQVRLPELFGDKVFKVRDRMNSKYNYEKIGYYRIDVWMPSREEAVQFGVKRLEMEIYGKVGGYKIVKK